MRGHIGAPRRQNRQGRRRAVAQGRQHRMHRAIAPIDRQHGRRLRQQRLQGHRHIGGGSGNLLAYSGKATEALDQRRLARISPAACVTEDCNAIHKSDP